MLKRIFISAITIILIMRDIIILMSSTYLNQCPDTMCLNIKKIVSRHGIFQRHGSGKPGFYIYLRHENFRVFDTGHFPTDVVLLATIPRWKQYAEMGSTSRKLCAVVLYDTVAPRWNWL